MFLMVLEYWWCSVGNPEYSESIPNVLLILQHPNSPPTPRLKKEKSKAKDLL